jgi:hypothetical protein
MTDNIDDPENYSIALNEDVDSDDDFDYVQHQIDFNASISEYNKERVHSVIVLINLHKNSCCAKIIKNHVYIRCKDIIESKTVLFEDKKLVYENICKYTLFSDREKRSLWLEGFD